MKNVQDAHIFFTFRENNTFLPVFDFDYHIVKLQKWTYSESNRVGNIGCGLSSSGNTKLGKLLPKKKILIFFEMEYYRADKNWAHF